MCINENWITEPPNILFFAINRLQYDTKSQKKVKNLTKFTFEKTIYVDRMIEANQGRIKRIRQVVKEIKDEIRQLRAQLETLNKTTLANSFLETTEYLK